MKILFMMTEPRVMKYYHETLRFMLKSGHSVHVAYFSLEKYRKGTLHEELVAEFGAGAAFPVLSGFPAGHGEPNLPLPFGPRALLDPEAGRLAFLEPLER